jgi:hypothetical protein
MFTLNYLDFVEREMFSSYEISYMPGLKVMHMDSAKVLINLNSKKAFVYYE